MPEYPANRVQEYKRNIVSDFRVTEYKTRVLDRQTDRLTRVLDRQRGLQTHNSARCTDRRTHRVLVIQTDRLTRVLDGQTDSQEFLQTGTQTDTDRLTKMLDRQTHKSARRTYRLTRMLDRQRGSHNGRRTDRLT